MKSLLKILPILAFSTAAALLVAPATAQVRTKKKPLAEQSFPDKLAAAKAAFAAGKFGLAIKLTEEATRIARAHLSKKVLALMPEIEGMKKLAQKKNTNPSAAALFGLGSAAIPLQTTYSGRGKSGQITVHLGGPVIKTQKAGLPLAKLDPKVEEIKYEAHSALLRKISDTRWALTIFFAKSDYGVAVRMNGYSDDALFAIFNQKWVDAVAKALGLS